MELAKAGDTILVSGEIEHNFFNAIDKPIVIQGEGEAPVPVSGGVNLPKNVAGQVRLKNFSFNGSSTIGLYGTSTEYEKLDLVLEDCIFTQASGNCVYIIPAINSLTITGCTFTAPDSENYQKQYLIWPYAAKTITITNNVFDGKGNTRAAVHLGDGHAEGTEALLENNTFENFERGVQLAFVNSASNDVTIKGNTFENIALSKNTISESYETATVFVHENLDTKGSSTTVCYDENHLTGTSERIAYTENGTVSADQLFASFNGNTINGENAGALEDNWFNVFVARIGDQKFKSLQEAMNAAAGQEGNVTVTLLSDVDISDPAVRSFDLSSSQLSGLTICGLSKNVKLISGVDGNDIDGPNAGNNNAPYCPVLSVTLPTNATFTVENLTFPNDLLFDSPDGTVVVQNCVFNGAQSGYPKANKISYLNNTFEFTGKADKFYSHNAYPVWYKLENEKDFVFTGNTVIGYRGVHIETRGQADLKVDNNHFTLKDSDHGNKCVALQLVGKVNGDVSFCDNYVDAYMAVCLYKELAYTSGKMTVENNYLVSGCKLFGSNEWSSSWTDEEAADAFAEAFMETVLEEGGSVSESHTKHNYVDGTCTICGRTRPSTSGSNTPQLPVALPTAPELTPEPTDPSTPSGFVSDTTSDLTVDGVYQFRITSLDGTVPFMTVSNANFRVEFVSQEGSDYFFKIYAQGAAGSTTEISVNGTALLTATVGGGAQVDGVISDTTAPFTVAEGGTYQFRLTASERPSFAAGSASFTVEYAGQIGSDYFYKVHAVGEPGDGCGFYINGASTPVAVAHIA